MDITLKEHTFCKIISSETTDDKGLFCKETKTLSISESAYKNLKISPRKFKTERNQDYYCFEKVIKEKEIHIKPNYFVGLDWLCTKSKRYIFVEPKINETVLKKFNEVLNEEEKNADEETSEETKTESDTIENEVTKDSCDKEVNFLKMLMEIMSLPEVAKHSKDVIKIYWEEEEIVITQQQDLLTPFLVVQFLNLVQDIVRKGLKKSYYKVQENLRNRIKGKILVGQQIKQNTFKNRFTNTYCEYQVFGEDNLENRFLKKVFGFCAKYVQDNSHFFKEKLEVSWLINYIHPAFEHISSEVDIQEIKHYKNNPFFKEYKEAIKIGQQILKRFSYNITKTTKEKLSTPPFWIDMPKMFELYVYAQLLKDNPELNADNFNYQFSTNGNALDFLICTSNKKIVVDTKYKLKYNYSQIHEDIRQVAGYARLKKVREEVGLQANNNEEISCLIIYPKPIETEFNTKLVIDSLLSEEIMAYYKVYKLGINLPTIK